MNSRFDNIDDINKKFIVDGIITSLRERVVSPQILHDNITISYVNQGDRAELKQTSMGVFNMLFETLSTMGVLQPLGEIDEEGRLKCMIGITKQIPDDMRELLESFGYNDDDLRGILGEKPDAEKEVVSKLIDPNMPWVDTTKTEQYPADGHCVAIRIWNPTDIVAENQTQKIPREDIAVAFRQGGEWIIEGPYPYIEVSPLFDGAKPGPNAVITQWREADAEEIKAWRERYDPVNTYGFLDLIVDDESKRDVYRALVYGGNALERFAKSIGNDKTADMFQYLANVLSDMAGIIDRGRGIYNEREDALKELEIIELSLEEETI